MKLASHRRCRNCGKRIYMARYFCSKLCIDAYQKRWRKALEFCRVWRLFPSLRSEMSAPTKEAP